MRSRISPALRALQFLVGGVIFWFFAVPVIIVAISSVSGEWLATVFPTGLTLKWFARLDASDWQAVATSLEVSTLVAVLGTALGVWLALSVNDLEGRRLGGLIDAVIMVPNAVPSVVVGLAVLLAYHAPPLDISRSWAIVVLVQVALVLPFCYRINAAALKQEIPIYREAAAGLGAAPPMVLRRVMLPLLEPAIRASLAIAFALSLGELGATLMVYPPGFATVPIVVIGDVERGFYYLASALAFILLALSLIVLVLVAGRKRLARSTVVAER